MSLVSDHSGKDGRERLIEGAIRCVADHGLSAATVRRIADYSGVTQGLIRHHFGGKTELLAECYRHLNLKALGRMEAVERPDAETVEQALDRTLAAFFPEDLRDTPQMRVLVAFWSAVLTDEQFSKVQAATNKAFVSYLSALVETHAGPGRDTGDLADGMMAVVDGLWLECCMNPDRMPPERAIAIARRIWLEILQGGVADGVADGP